MSWSTRTCPSHPAPAPIPIVGIVTAAGDPLRQRRRDLLQHDAEGAGFLEHAGIVDQDVPRGTAPLHSVAAELQDRLRGQAEVPHHRDPGFGHLLDRVHAPAAPLDLDRVGAGLLQDPSRRFQRLLGTDLEGEERHVDDDHAPSGARA